MCAGTCYGTCQAPDSSELGFGDICYSGGAETGPIVDKSELCPKGSSCQAQEGVMGIGGEVPKTCQKLTAKLQNAKWCPDSNPQLCKMMCPPTPPQCVSGECAMRTDAKCCDYTCTNPGKDTEAPCPDMDIDSEDMEQLQEKFNAADTNKSGEIDKDEFVVALESYGAEDSLTGMAATLIQVFDNDGDRELSLCEFVSMVTVLATAGVGPVIGVNGDN